MRTHRENGFFCRIEPRATPDLRVSQRLVLLGSRRPNPYVTRRLHRFFFGAEPAIAVLSADYGLNCKDFPVPAGLPKLTRPGNATSAVQESCDGMAECRFLVSVAQLGDPANGCGKAFSVRYTCDEGSTVFSVSIPGEADGKTAVLACPKSAATQ